MTANASGFVARSTFFAFLSTLFFVGLAQAQETSLTGHFQESTPRSRFGTSYFNFSSADASAAENGFPTISIYNYLSLHYKYDRDQRFSIRPVWQMYTAGYDFKGNQTENDVTLGDLHLNYSNYNIAVLPGDWELSGQVKWYFPTSESAQQKKIITYFKGELISEKLLGNNWVLQYTAKPGYWFHSQRSFRSETNDINSRGIRYNRIDAKLNKWGELEHYMGVGKVLNSVFTPKLETGFVHEWSYASENVEGRAVSSNQLKIAPNTEIHLTRQLWFILGIENTIELNDSRIASNQWQNAKGQSINLFQPEDTQYYLMTFLSL